MPLYRFSFSLCKLTSLLAKVGSAVVSYVMTTGGLSSEPWQMENVGLHFKGEGAWKLCVYL